MSSVNVNIAIYNPIKDEDPSHWAISLIGNGTQIILQVGRHKGGTGYYVEKPIYNKSPEKSSRYNQSIAVGVISYSDLDHAVFVIQNTPVDNNSKTWNCQAWVVEALNRLCDAAIFQWDSQVKFAVLAKRQDWQ